MRPAGRLLYSGRPARGVRNCMDRTLRAALISRNLTMQPVSPPSPPSPHRLSVTAPTPGKLEVAKSSWGMLSTEPVKRADALINAAK